MDGWVMMKKVFYVLLVLLITSQLSASTTSRTIDIINMWTAGASGSSCPAYYADTNVVFSWDGDHASGTNYGCDNGGTGVAGTNTNLTISTSYGEGGSSNGALIDNVNERLEFADSGDQYIDDDSNQTWCARIYIETAPASSSVFFLEANDGSNTNMLRQYIDTTPNYQCGYKADASNDYAAGTGPTEDDWITVCHSWNGTVPNGDHSAYPGNPGAEDVYDVTEWEEDANEIDTQMTANLTSFMVGEEYGGGADDASGVIYVDQFVIMNGYEQAPPANWLN